MIIVLDMYENELKHSEVPHQHELQDELGLDEKEVCDMIVLLYVLEKLFLILENLDR